MKSTKVNIALISFVSIIVGLLLAAAFFLTSSTGAELDDPKLILQNAVEQTIDQDGNWAYQTTAIDGNHPWALESIISRGNVDGAAYSLEFFGENIMYVSDGEASYIKLGDPELQKLENWTGRVLLDASASKLASKLSENLEASGLLTRRSTFNDFQITNTLQKERSGQRLLRHYEFVGTRSTTLDNFTKLLSSQGLELQTLDDAEVSIIFDSGEIWIDDETGKLVKATMLASYGDDSYKLEIVPIVTLGPEAYLLTDEEEVPGFEIFSDYQLDEATSLLSSLGLDWFSHQLRDSRQLADLLVIRDIITSYSEENFFYPTAEELNELLKLPENLELLSSGSNLIYYQALAEDCNNLEDNYCSDYKLWFDGFSDGRGDKDQDQATEDVFRTSN